MVATDCEPQKEDHQSKQLPEAEQHNPAQDRDLARKTEQERRRREAVSCWLLPADFVSTSAENKTH